MSKLMEATKVFSSGVQLSRIFKQGFWGDTYEFKTATTLEDFLGLTHQGWKFHGQGDLNKFLINLVLNMYNDLNKE